MLKITIKLSAVISATVINTRIEFPSSLFQKWLVESRSELLLFSKCRCAAFRWGNLGMKSGCTRVKATRFNGIYCVCSIKSCEQQAACLRLLKPPKFLLARKSFLTEKEDLGKPLCQTSAKTLCPSALRASSQPPLPPMMSSEVWSWTSASVCSAKHLWFCLLTVSFARDNQITEFD